MGFHKNILIINYNTWEVKILKKFFKTRRPYETKKIYKKLICFKSFIFWEKIKFFYYKFFIIDYPLGISSSRDNSIIFIKDHIEINVCDLDVELNFYICEEASYVSNNRVNLLLSSPC